MPSSYPPHSGRRSNSGSRDRRSRQQRPFQEFEREQEKHSKWKTFRGHLVAAASEFIGTTMFLWFAFAGTQASAQNGGSAAATSQGLLFVSLSFGFSLMVTVWAHYRISGGLFNPAVTLALAITKNVPWIRSAFLLPAQLLGGIVAAALVKCMLPGELAVVTRLSEGTSIAQGVFIEAFGTCLLVFVILMVAAEKHETTPLAPVAIGLALFVAELGTVLYTGGSLNPARSFGPSVAEPDFPGYHYIYWFGPIIGALMASAYYGLCRYNHYWEANPGQDSKGHMSAQKS
ncbi:hypothetical protein LTR70_007754 [Exophiala xenobiotica]|uniref:Aquaporin n=1 Tax=Lithohypha guttulata TaxID=1690604 RepID=A0ABR0K2V6_9EURO|nr:hypothetical protein LTR24_007466 [Lithohypha guttulata]KAK5313136.1 hypothetical protein LTR70_007754 [Exophiala xenobiotica]